MIIFFLSCSSLFSLSQSSGDSLERRRNKYPLLYMLQSVNDIELFEKLLCYFERPFFEKHIGLQKYLQLFVRCEHQQTSTVGAFSLIM